MGKYVIAWFLGIPTLVLGVIWLLFPPNRSQPITTEQMAAKVAECRRYGLETEVWRNISHQITAIDCAPPRLSAPSSQGGG